MRAGLLTVWLALLAGACAQTPEQVQAPRFWNDQELSDWATPLASLNVRPGHFSERDYYAAPDAEWVRTYPVYFPGREPAGYWDMMRAKKPEPLFTPGARTTAAWIDDGRRVFEEMDVPGFRSMDPQSDRRGAVGRGVHQARRSCSEGRSGDRPALGADVKGARAQHSPIARLVTRA